MIRRAFRPSSLASAAIVLAASLSSHSQVAKDAGPLAAALPEQRGFAAQDADLFLPFSAIPGAPEAAPELVTPELRQMIDEALEEPLMGDPPEPRPPAQPVDPKLLALATQTAGRVVGLRVWDGFGEELARGCGCFISASGDVLTDLSLVRPSHARRIEYITVLTGSGDRHRITGFRWQDERSGLAILTTDATDTPFLTLQTRSDFSRQRPVRILALHEERGVILADAFAQADASRSGEGWLNLRGDDSPGEPGSPVIDDQGEAVGMVALRVPSRQWVNFGVSLAAVAGDIASALKLPERPLARLATSSGNRIASDERFLTAFQNLYAGGISTAISQLLRLRQSYPRSAEVWALLGLACARAGAAEEARNCNRKAVALDPSVGQYWYQLGFDHSTLADAQDRSAAIEALQHTIEQRPTDVPAWLLLAERQVVEGHFREAEKSLLQIIKLRPQFAHALYLLSYTRGKLGDYSGAELAVKESLRLDRKSARAWFYLGLLLTKEKRFAEAVEALRETVAVAPQHPHAWLNLAVLQRRMGRITDAALAHAQHQRVTSPRK
jgi:tetratricopeptide (TPR) repeat protein